MSYEQIQCYIYDSTKPYYANNNQNQPLWISGISGCVACFGADTIVSPLELIRTKMQSKKLSYSEVHRAMQSLLKYHCYKGIWKGLGSTLLRDVLFSGELYSFITLGFRILLFVFIKILLKDNNKVLKI